MTQRTKAFSRPSGRTHGVLVVDKPQGITSHQVVAHVRRVFGTKRVGHAGTLDPMATGVLVMLLGEATKLSEVLSTERKTYEAVVRFGTATTSLDADGQVLKSVELSPNWLSREALSAALDHERERVHQIPPQVSAIKVNGVRSYARARKGEVVDLAPRHVTVHDLRVLSESFQELRLLVRVSKGYYVRALARDLGDTLQVPAHLSALRRIESGCFSLVDAVPYPVDERAQLLSLSSAARMSVPSLELTEEGRERAIQGKRLSAEHFSGEGPSEGPVPVAAFCAGALVALLEPAETGLFRVKRGFNLPAEPSAPCDDPPSE